MGGPLVSNVFEGIGRPIAPNENTARDGPTHVLSSKPCCRHAAAGAAVADQYFQKPSIGCNVSIVMVLVVLVLDGGGPSDSPSVSTSDTDQARSAQTFTKSLLRCAR